VFILVLVAGTAIALAARAARAEGKDLDGVVNLNTAAPEMLELLPGIGPAKVHSILWYRQRHPFRTVDELVRIKGIGRKMVRRLRVHLAVSGPTTARAVRRPVTFDLPPPPPAATLHKPAPAVPAHAAPKSGSKLAAVPGRPTIPPPGRGRPSPPAGRERRSRANHCARPP